MDAVVTGATRRGLLIGFELPGSSHLMGDDSLGMQEREQPAPRPGNSPEITSALLGFRVLLSYFSGCFGVGVTWIREDFMYDMCWIYTCASVYDAFTRSVHSPAALIPGEAVPGRDARS